MEEETTNIYTGLLFKILFMIFIFLCIFLISYFSYVLYLNVPRQAQNLNVVMDNLSEIKIQGNVSLSEVKQFHQNMKFNHNTISYSIDSNCLESKKQRMIAALDYLSGQVSFIRFKETSDNADIEITCSEIERSTVDSDSSKDFFIAGEGGAKEIIQTGKYNVITSGAISLYKSPHGAIECDFPNVEIHELIHVFGFDHSSDKNSLMNPLLNSCDQVLDPSIINELKRLYSEQNLADLYFENVTAVKKGRYLDFNVTIKNSGTINAKNINFFVFDDGELIEEKQIDEISFGAGMVFRVENLKMSHLDPKEIKFVIDKDNLINELDKKNNMVIVKPDS